MGRHLEGKSPAVTQLRPWHKTMARMHLAGKRPGELAAIFGMSPGQVSRILGSPLFLAEMERLESRAEFEAVDMSLELQARQGMALEAIDRGLTAVDPKLAVSTGFEILDRTGFSKRAEPTLHEHKHVHLHKEIKDMSEEELAMEAQKLVAEEG